MTYNPLGKYSVHVKSYYCPFLSYYCFIIKTIYFIVLLALYCIIVLYYYGIVLMDYFSRKKKIRVLKESYGFQI